MFRHDQPNEAILQLATELAREGVDEPRRAIFARALTYMSDETARKILRAISSGEVPSGALLRAGDPDDVLHERVSLSQYFSWASADFNKEDTVPDFDPSMVSDYWVVTGQEVNERYLRPVYDAISAAIVDAAPFVEDVNADTSSHRIFAYQTEKAMPLLVSAMLRDNEVQLAPILDWVFAPPPEGDERQALIDQVLPHLGESWVGADLFGAVRWFDDVSRRLQMGRNLSSSNNSERLAKAFVDGLIREDIVYAALEIGRQNVFRARVAAGIEAGEPFEAPRDAHFTVPLLIVATGVQNQLEQRTAVAPSPLNTARRVYDQWQGVDASEVVDAAAASGSRLSGDLFIYAKFLEIGRGSTTPTAHVPRREAVIFQALQTASAS